MFLTSQVPSDKIRDNETAEEHFQNLEWCKELAWCWRRRVRAVERLLHILVGFKPTWNLKFPLPVCCCSLVRQVTCSTSVSQMLISIPCDPRRRSPAGGHLVACLDFRVRWGRFHRCEVPNVMRANWKTYL